MKKGICIAVALFCILFAGKAASAQETAQLRVISTTDIHNQVNSQNYDSASTNTQKTLAKLSTMINTARAECDCSITVDAGDSVFGYGAEVTMGNLMSLGEENELNDNLMPVYAAMSQIGYDVIVPGNHDFDYGYDFLKNQLEMAGLTDACVLANVREWGTGVYPWQQTKMITKQVTTSEGNVRTIKIGIVGATQQGLSGIYEYDGTLVGESMLASVREQAAELKSQGADIVIAVTHGGMGSASSGDDGDNVGYAVTLIDDVDCVVLGHQHRNFPSSDVNVQSWYSLPNVDADTGLVNGKPVVMVKDHADGIGVEDLTLAFTDDGVEVVRASAEVRECTALVMSDPAIESVTDAFDDLVKATYSEVLADVEDGTQITGYFGFLEDNYAIQLNNEAKIRYGMNFTHSAEGIAYRDLPVIAATPYFLDGSEGMDDYIDISGIFTFKDLLNTQAYQHYKDCVYWITGAQLKEWLEWSASIYAVSDETIRSDSVLSQLMTQYGASSVVSDEWLDNWENFTVFDGVEYQIDATEPARYSAQGELIDSSAHRIVSLTCNGQTVRDTTRFVLVYHLVEAKDPVNAALRNQRLTKKEYNCVYQTKNYIEELGSFEPLTDQSDNNWSVSFGNSSQKIVRSGLLSEICASLKSWFSGLIGETEKDAYYLADMSQTDDTDTSGPLLVLCASDTEPTNEDITVYIRATDASGVDQVLALEGQVEETDTAWENATVVENGEITVSENSVWSVLAQDGNGNVTVKHIAVDNIDRNILPAPTIDKFTNKKTELTGQAQAKTTVHVTIGSKVYNTTATASGTYSCEVKKPQAGDKISVYLSDNEGRVSATTTSVVIRRAPNTPTLSAVTNKDKKITGKVNDTYSTIVAYIGGTAYVQGSDGEKAYKSCENYSSSMKINKTAKYTVKDEKYTITVPTMAVDTKVTVFAVDDQGRCSAKVNRTVKDAAPNQPNVDEVCSTEKCVSGVVPDPLAKYTVKVKAGGKTYKGKSKANGKFVVSTKAFSSGTVLKVTASDVFNGQKRTSAVTECTVSDGSDYTLPDGESQIRIQEVTTASLVVKGTVLAEGNVYLSTGKDSAKLDLSADGKFSYTLAKPLTAGTEITVSCHDKKTGDVIEVKTTTVRQVKPKKPTVDQKTVAQTKTKLTVYSEQKAKVLVQVNGKTKKTKKCKYDKKKKKYAYTVKIPAGKGKITCTVTNSAGTSKAKKVRRK